jgi:nucleoside-diphosphate-sugar epimerase
MQAMVVGTGFVGGLIADALAAQGHGVRRVSARLLLSRGCAAELGGEASDVCFFAHGKSVGVRRFAAHFDDLLQSRTGVIEAAAAIPALAKARTILISSTVACVTPPEREARDLPALQRRFETGFLERFPAGSILRVGAVFGPGSQIEDGLPLLAKTRVMKRIRMRGATDIPWIEGSRLGEVCLRMLEAIPAQKIAVANSDGFDINAVLDRAYHGRWKLRLPVAAFLGLYVALGMPRHFATVTMDDVRQSQWNIVAE